MNDIDFRTGMVKERALDDASSIIQDQTEDLVDDKSNLDQQFEQTLVPFLREGLIRMVHGAGWAVNEIAEVFAGDVEAGGLGSFLKPIKKSSIKAIKNMLTNPKKRDILKKILKSETLPEFLDTGNALKFGLTATPEQQTQLKIRRIYNLRKASQFQKNKDLNNAMRFGVKAQLDREAIQAKEIMSGQ